MIKCKIHLELSWTKNCVMSSVAGDTEFKIANTKLNVPIATLSTEDNVKLTKQLSERFKRSVYWNQYRMETKTMKLESNNPLRILLDAFSQGVKGLSVLAFDDTENGNKRVKKSHRKYFLPRADITNYNVLTLQAPIPLNGQTHSNWLSVFDQFVKLALKGLRMSMKMFDGDELPHESLLTTRQKNKIKKCI